MVGHSENIPQYIQGILLTEIVSQIVLLYALIYAYMLFWLCLTSYFIETDSFSYLFFFIIATF